MGEDNFTGSKTMRKKQRRPPTNKGQRHSTTHREKQVWEKKRPDERAAQNGQPRIHSQRGINGDTKQIRSPHAWKNKFVSHMI